MVGRSLGEEGVVAPAHKGNVIGVTLFDRDLVNHGLNGRKLILTAEGHHNRARADGGVKTLGKTSARTAVEVGCECAIIFGEGKL